MAGLSDSSLFFLFVLLGGQFVLFACVLAKRAQEFWRPRRAGPPPEKKKFWIRRHKILAFLAPFGAAMLFCSAGPLSEARAPRSESVRTVVRWSGSSTELSTDSSFPPFPGSCS